MDDKPPLEPLLKPPLNYQYAERDNEREVNYRVVLPPAKTSLRSKKKPHTHYVRAGFLFGFWLVGGQLGGWLGWKEVSGGLGGWLGCVSGVAVGGWW